MKSKDNRKEDRENWENFIVKNIDYIANPTIEVKNLEICSYFIDYIIPALRQDNLLLKNIKKKIEILNSECYCPEQVEGMDLHKEEW